MLTVGSLFSGIGGLELGLERTGGFRTLWQCEIDPYCRAVLRKHWPDVYCYEDIRDINGETEPVDVLCGGFPCQPVSVAGKGLAQEDPRWLWPEFARVVGLLQPRYVIVENVPGLRKRGLSNVVGDLAALGYDAEWNIVSAASVGAPHLRKRLFVVAYPRSKHLRLERGGIERQGGEGALLTTRDGEARIVGALADANGSIGFGPRATSETLFQLAPLERLRRRCSSDGGQWAAEPNVGRVADGVSDRLDKLRLLGNSVVPQVAQFVGELILGDRVAC